MTIHDEIDNYLTADLHNELSDEERNALHTHLVECAACRQTHQETRAMNKILEEKLENEKPDVAFEERMLAHFRNRAPVRSGLIKCFTDIPSFRVARVAAFALLLLALVELGRNLTGEGPLARQSARYALAKRAATGGKSEEQFSQYAEGALRMKGVAPAAPHVSSVDEAGVSSTDTYRRDDKEAAVVPQNSTGGLKPSAKSAEPEEARADRVVVVGSNIPTAEEVGQNPETTPIPALANRKLIRNATVDLEVVKFDETVQRITAFASEEKGYVATTSSTKQANGKLLGEIVVKILPENLDRFLQKIRGLGELKNQTLGTEDITKNYFDTEARLKNARVMESRLIDMLKKKSDDINDLLQVEKELGRVREEIEKMQGDLKYWDSQVQFATVTISLAEKDLEEPAKFLVKERAQLALYSPDVEKIYNDIKALASQKVQITNAQLDRDYSGRVSARLSMLIVPEESEAVIARVKGFGRVENFQTQTERIAQAGEGMSENAKTKRDKVELNITISRDEQEQAFQQTTLRIRTSSVDGNTKQLRELTEKQDGRIRSSTFSRDPDGRESANVSLRVPMKNYNALMQSLNALGKVENVSVQRQDRTGSQVDEANAPADISIQVYSRGNIVSSETGLWATLRNTLAQGAAALMWSLRMIGVALAFLAPWVIALVAIVWIAGRITRARRG